MAIKATFPSGVTSVTLPPLYQWDYGQVLEIESEDKLSPVVEVHFSCAGMTEAEVRICAFADNDIATVKIPDSCLEQTANITAFVYEKDVDNGRTTKAISIPIIARARPSRPVEIPVDASDCYTQLIAEVNEAIGALRDGTVTVKNAENAKKAETANTALSATTASTAQEANTANEATRSKILHHSSWTLVLESNEKPLTKAGLYLVRFDLPNNEKRVELLYFNPVLFGNHAGAKVASNVVLVYMSNDEGVITETRYIYFDDNGCLWEVVENPTIGVEEAEQLSYSYIILMGNN